LRVTALRGRPQIAIRTSQAAAGSNLAGFRYADADKKENDMSGQIRFINPASIGAPRGYSHVVEATGPGRTLYIAGQLGLNAENKFPGAPGDFRA